ncbi:hypothetical protein C474_16224 [Halogeometricum pallidum JCM 14848]|uniref:DUF7344 domain-containing protein n=1 Tax=Halogeometricum pallidum JCM 14848 TaxID=1227487 RepID=M0D1Q2_HALPD|nr:hypothetical protein [Halogeometricum pallidum]ELZ28064.1 hypothetical protein C474_16224 [Halogeometricum pallidum JCM 14848]
MTNQRRTAVAPLSGDGRNRSLAPYLRNRRRRLVVSAVDAASESLELSALARRVTAVETGVPASVVCEETAREVCLSLYNNHLPALCAQAVLKVRSRESVVVPGERFAEAVDYLRQSGRAE